MERKIGEIFEIGGEWYQCVKGIGCFQCVFNRTLCVRSNISRDIIGNCSKNTREDRYAVIFKKLEKVGKPYFDNEYNIWIQAYRPYITVTDIDILPTFISTKGDGLIHLEIKQNKEEMVNKKTNFVEEVDALCKRYNMAEGVRADFMAEVKEIIKDENRECKLKPFDLEAAKLGKPVCTRDGRKARIICFDANGSNSQQIIALITDENGFESSYSFTNEGRWTKEVESVHDLMMLTKKKEGWVNIDKGGSGKITVSSPYSTKEEAIHNDNETTIDTIKISWEE